MTQAGDLHFPAEDFGSENFAVPAEVLVGADSGSAENLDRTMEARLSGADGGGDVLYFPVTFSDPAGEKGFGDRLQTYPQLSELSGQSHGKGIGDLEIGRAHV